MADSTEVTLMVPTREGNVGDRVSVSVARARQLVAGGVARYPTKTAAKQAGADPDKAATAK